MTYVGAVPTTGDFKLLDSITTSSSTTFNLRQSGVAVFPQSSSHVLCVLNGILQTSGSSFNIVNDTIVFAEALTSSDVINQILVLGNVNDIGVPSDDTVSTAKLQANAVTSAKIASGVIPSTRPNVNPLMINGDMAVAQRGTSFTSVSSGSNFPVDRFEFYPNSLGTYTIIQEALTSGEAYNNGFRTALRIDTTTADASPSSTDYAILRTKFEGQDLQMIKKGTANAEKLTLAFWVKSNKTTTGQVNLFDIDNNRLVSGTYTISSANTWEKKVINFSADTTGAFDNNNALSLIVEFFLDGGSNFTSGTAPTSWEAQSNADRNANNFAIGSSTDNDFAITGVQLEVGEYTSSTLPPFQHESYGDNLSRCQRYYYQVTGTGKGRFANGNFFTQAIGDVIVPFPCKMRAAYSLSTSATSDIMITSVTAEADCTAISLDTSLSLDAADVRFTVGSNIATVGHVSTMILKDSSSYLAFDTEL